MAKPTVIQMSQQIKILIEGVMRADGKAELALLIDPPIDLRDVILILLQATMETFFQLLNAEKGIVGQNKIVKEPEKQ